MILRCVEDPVLHSPSLLCRLLLLLPEEERQGGRRDAAGGRQDQHGELSQAAASLEKSDHRPSDKMV